MTDTKDELLLNDMLDLSILDSGRIFLSGDIDVDSAMFVIKAMRYLVGRGFEEIVLFIHTNGGDVDDAVAIIDEIVGHQSNGINIVGVVLGHAYSSGALILTFCNNRYATANSSIMLHPFHYEVPSDYVGQQKSLSDFTSKQYNNLMDKVARNCGRKNKEQITKFNNEIKEGLWLSAQEAIKHKVIDEIWDYSKEKDIDDRNKTSE